jgi:acyl-CoA reductase-like NAD-dependent aldehyde dehydrogenase
MCFNAGQCCVSASRILVHRAVEEAFKRKLLDKLASVRVGDPLDERTQVGALFTQAHLDKVIRAIESAQAAGAQLAFGGCRIGPASGFFVAPTLLTGVTRDMALAREEVFGPVAALTCFDTLDEAIAEANASEYGLAASLWTRDLTTAIRAMRQVDAGRIWVNTAIDGGPETPIGGMKHSGLGRDAGMAGIEEYTETKTAHIRLHPASRWAE